LKLDTIHAVCYVAKSSTTRLSSTEQYILANVGLMFGNDVAHNFLTLGTFYGGGNV